MEIRKLTIKDYAALTELWTKAGLSFKPKVRDSKESIAAQMKAYPDFFFGVFEDGKLLGAVLLSSDLRRGWINRLTVDPDYRRCGVAKALIAEAEKILREKGLRIFCVQVEADNVASKELFKNCGYVEHDDMVYFSKRDSNEV